MRGARNAKDVTAPLTPGPSPRTQGRGENDLTKECREKMSLRASARIFGGLAALAVLGVLAACWVIPLRLARSGPQAWYQCAFIGDEYYYASRVHPLIAHTTATNPVNGVCDPRMISQYFLEDALRIVVTFSGIHVISFMWLWRVLFPVLLLGTMFLLACATMKRTRPPWSSALRILAACAGFILLYLGHDLVIEFPPLQGWLNRFPTNIEFPLSVALAAAFIHFTNTPTAPHGVLLALSSAATVYLRMYTAMPWGIAITITMVWLVLEKRVKVKPAMITLGVLMVLLIPWVAIVYSNGQLLTQKQLMARYFPLVQFSFSPHWAVYFSFAALFCGAAFRVERQHRPLFISAAISLVILTLVSGRVRFASELIYDRFAPFYLVVFIAAGLMLLGRFTQDWRGHLSLMKAGRCSAALFAASAIAACAIALTNLNYDFSKYPVGPYRSIADETAYLPAYNWILANTPDDALFLFDDGHDWSSAKFPDDARLIADLQHQGDLFQIIARRRRALNERLLNSALSDADLDALTILQRGTFGHPIVGNEYLNAIKRYAPQYVFLRKNLSSTRGMLPKLKGMSKVVYQDDFCEVWNITYRAQP